MHRRTQPPIDPRRDRDLECELPELGRWVRRLREHRPLSRPEAAGLLHISAELLKKIEYGTAACTQPVLEQMITTYGLDIAQARHTNDLAQSPIPLTTVEELRARHISGDHLTTLNKLDERGLAAAYIDPLCTVMHANNSFRAGLPGVDRYDDNLALWFFHPGTTEHTAEPLVVHWDDAAAYLVASLRATFGIHRQSPHAQQLFQKLSASVVFTELWNTKLDVAYGRQIEEPVQLREPDTGQRYSVRIHLGARVRAHLDTPDLRFCIGYRDPSTPPPQL